MGLIGWLVAIGCLLVGAAIGVWGLTEINRTITIWLIGVPGAICLVLGAGFELQKLADGNTPPANRPDAYVFVEASELRYLGTNRPPEGWISLKNGGTLPARELRRIATIGAARYPYNDFRELPVGDARSVLGPGGAVDFGPITLSRNLNPVEINAVIAGTMAIYIWGKVHYVSGQDNRPGCVNFRLMYRGNGQLIGPHPLALEQLEEGNNTDCP